MISLACRASAGAALSLSLKMSAAPAAICAPAVAASASSAVAGRDAAFSTARANSCTPHVVRSKGAVQTWPPDRGQQRATPQRVASRAKQDCTRAPLRQWWQSFCGQAGHHSLASISCQDRAHIGPRLASLGMGRVQHTKSGLGRPVSSLGRRPCRGTPGRQHVPAVASASSSTPGPDVGPEGPLRVALICGGPSAERGISLNSARSVLDHLGSSVSDVCKIGVRIDTYYLSPDLRAYSISKAQMYSNTPSDFDFKLDSTAMGFGSLEEFTQHIAATADIAFPALHGRYGEDGGIQALLEGAGVPFVGTGATECMEAFDKFRSNAKLRRMGFATLPAALLEADAQSMPRGESVEALRKWFGETGLDAAVGKVVVKPARAGSSVGVSVVRGVGDVVEAASELMAQGVDDRVVVEPFVDGSNEFTVIVLASKRTQADGTSSVALLPSEVELRLGDQESADEDAIFNYRRKYLPTAQVHYHTPPRFPTPVLDEIRHSAVALFEGMGLRDYARIDGWWIPPESPADKRVRDGRGRSQYGSVVFSDINVTSGMEQTSFLFQQAAEAGMCHADVLGYILRRACARYPEVQRKLLPTDNGNMQPAAEGNHGELNRQKVYVLFGGDTSERQVSLMSGTNVWLKLRTLMSVDAQPFLLAPTLMGNEMQVDELGERTVWQLPYNSILRHTVEEVMESCESSVDESRALARRTFKAEVKESLALDDTECNADTEAAPEPARLTLAEMAEKAKEEGAVVFIAVHGGVGEDGRLQTLLCNLNVPYTGSDPDASRLCMDKAATGEALVRAGVPGLTACPKETIHMSDVAKKMHRDPTWTKRLWDRVTSTFGCADICVKPAADGCSTGVARITCPADLEEYLRALCAGQPRILPGTLTTSHPIIELPVPPPERVLLEPFIQTENIGIKPDGSLEWGGCSPWIETTVGVMGPKGEMQALTPSITVREIGDVLSLEEKFQGGTGVNLTPPPPQIIGEEQLERIRANIAAAAKVLGLGGFARIDAFVNSKDGQVMVIEANTVPGLTPSTVLFHQTLAEQPPMYPPDFFARIVERASRER
mmetsp:Transcript_9928/g.36304  ORF Transcript_9928/g.36304 Transcript_9928/m.36304 type:complete len:1061 (+) Transcript_9928:97-3279(+)